MSERNQNTILFHGNSSKWKFPRTPHQRVGHIDYTTGALLVGHLGDIGHKHIHLPVLHVARSKFDTLQETPVLQVAQRFDFSVRNPFSRKIKQTINASNGVATQPSLILPFPAHSGRVSIVPLVRNMFILMQNIQPA